MCLALPALAEEPPLLVSGMGSFHIGGRQAEVSGRPVREVQLAPGARPVRIDPNGTYRVDGMYVQYHHPATRRGRVPLMLWHGGGMTGVVWETTPDGREGWQTWFLRRGWSVYVSDAVERGRSGWAMFPDITPAEPIFLTMADPWERFRIGAGPGSWRSRSAIPGTQFPTDAYERFTAQLVPRWVVTDAAATDAYTQLLRQVGPAVVLTHAQSSLYALRVAKAEAERVRALVLLEPTAFGPMTPEELAPLRGMPVLVLYGDFIEQDPRWSAAHERGTQFVEALRAAGGQVEVVELPDRGIRGNSHLMMMDRNNGAVAEVVQGWLAARGLWE
ncbi:esterase [Rhodovarius crocodyli]|uniref:Esterase n=1 Tax=Rhodovarius crocodyli TaxID=1979269 RepID=A0A437MK64_9PROT|nr:esterase [Rhodovarius crocodyli]